MDKNISYSKPTLFIAINETSGKGVLNLPEIIKDKLVSAGHHVEMHKISGTNVKESCREFVQKASETNGIVIAAGGDGTVNAIAALCHEYNAKLGIIPLGTFNYFARVLNIPVEMEQALEVLSKGTIRKVSAGFVHDNLFLNNASFGLYSKIIRKREQASKHFGRKRPIAFISALFSLFQDQKKFSVQLNKTEGSEIHRTSMIFIGNNSLQLENFNLEAGKCTKQNKLAVVIMKPLNRLQTARLIWRGIVKNLNAEENLEQFCADSFEVVSKRKKINIVLDGELMQVATPIAFRVERDCLSVLVPSDDKEIK